MSRSLPGDAGVSSLSMNTFSLPEVRKTSPPPPEPHHTIHPESETASDSDSRARTRFRSKSPSFTRKNQCQNTSAPTPNGSNGLLSPPTPSWRSFSRSPSPLGLIPIHKTFRQLVSHLLYANWEENHSFFWHILLPSHATSRLGHTNKFAILVRQIHRHEVPRKVLHVSIGFLVLHLYRTGVQPTSITPVLGYTLVPIVSADILRFVSPSFNWLYIRVLGALMRESEFSGWNGVIWYMIGTWTVLAVFPKDVATLSILLLSWCDTAASTFGRLFGRYTPQIRKGKSLAGSLAAFVVGSATAAYFYGALVSKTPFWPDDPVRAISYLGNLKFPGIGEIRGTFALGIVSVVTGLIGSMSELVDVWGLDDNVVIPVLSAVGIWGFFRSFTP